jgi:hypothetical protein
MTTAKYSELKKKALSDAEEVASKAELHYRTVRVNHSNCSSGS